MIANHIRVIDDFYEDPDEVRAFALRATFLRQPLTSSDSLISDTRHPATLQTLAKLGSLVNAKPDVAQIENLHDFWEFAGCGEFQLRTGVHGIGRIHAHAHGQWVGVVYLSILQDTSPPGTLFFRHIATGATRYHASQGGDYGMFRRDATNWGAWEPLSRVAMKYNRLVLFDSTHFHAESPGFGDGPETGRLIQIFNFNEQRVSQELRT